MYQRRASNLVTVQKDENGNWSSNLKTATDPKMMLVEYYLPEIHKLANQLKMLNLRK